MFLVEIWFEANIQDLLTIVIIWNNWNCLFHWFMLIVSSIIMNDSYWRYEAPIQAAAIGWHS